MVAKRIYPNSLGRDFARVVRLVGQWLSRRAGSGAGDDSTTLGGQDVSLLLPGGEKVG